MSGNVVVKTYDEASMADAVVGAAGKSVNGAIRLGNERASVGRYLGHARFGADDVLVAFGSNDTCLGFATVRRQSDIGSSVVGLLITKDDGAVAMALLDRCRERASQHGTRYLRLPLLRAGCAAVASALEKRGLRYVRSYNRMCLAEDLFTYTYNNVKVPAGFAVLGGDNLGKCDIGLLTDLQNKTFASHFEYSANSVEEMAYGLGDLEDWSGRFLLLVPDGREIEAAAGFVQVSANGWLEMVGVLPEYRGSGLGRYLLIAGMKLLRDKFGAGAFRLEVDADNFVAKTLYENLGFQANPELTIDWFEE